MASTVRFEPYRIQVVRLEPSSVRLEPAPSGEVQALRTSNAVNLKPCEPQAGRTSNSASLKRFN